MEANFDRENGVLSRLHERFALDVEGAAVKHNRVYLGLQEFFPGL